MQHLPPPSSSMLSNTWHRLPHMPILGANKWRRSNNWPEFFNAQPSKANPTNHNHPSLSHLPRPIPNKWVSANIPVWKFQGWQRYPQWNIYPGCQQLQGRQQLHHPMFYPGRNLYPQPQHCHISFHHISNPPPMARPPRQLMWSHNRNHCWRTRLQLDPPCGAVPRPPFLILIILPCRGRHISSFLTQHVTLSATAATSIQHSSALDTPIQPLSTTVSNPMPSFTLSLVLFSNFSISLRAPISKLGPSHWKTNLYGWPKALGTASTAPTPYTSSQKRRCILTLKR